MKIYPEIKRLPKLKLHLELLFLIVYGIELRFLHTVKFGNQKIRE